MAGRVGVHLEVVSLGRATSWLKHTSTKLRHALVRGVEVLDPQIEMDLLRGCPVRPVRRDVVRCVLHPNAWFAIDDHHMPAIVTVDLTAEYSTPKRTLRFNVCGVESDDLIPDSHPANVPHTANSTIRTSDLAGCGTGVGDTPRRHVRRRVQSIPPVWARFVDTVPTLEREAGELMTYAWEPSRFRSVGAPTLLLAGELTDAPIYATREQLREAFPHAEEHAFEGQRHIAFAADPEGFANTVLPFTRRH